jgi:hypothetical protein
MTRVRVKEWESGSGFRTHFDAMGDQSLVVGETSESPRRFYSCMVESGRGSTEVGVISSDLGAAPAAVVLDQGRVLIVGHDTWLTWVNLNRPACERDRRLGGVFFKFFPVSDDAVVVLHELGVICVDSKGGTMWNVDTEVIEDHEVDASGNLILSIMDADSPVVVRIESVKHRS